MFKSFFMKRFLPVFWVLLFACVNENFAQSIDDSFFTQVKFRGAFDGSNDWTAGWSEFNPGAKVYGAATDTLGNGNTVSGTPFEITTNVALDKNKVYLLRGWVYVANGGVLTIPAGTVIRGDKTTVGTIIVERGGKINANGTVTEPIVFTSNQAVGNRNPGDWGGIIILGKAPVNRVDPKIEGGPRSIYGGTDPTDNSGIFNYIRLEYPGIAFQPNQEINGLTLGGVGQGTRIDNVQISFSGDDAFEWFGGNVNSKNLIAYKSIDDDFDTDFGFSGRVQFGLVLRDPALADVSGSNAFESDNYNPGINATNPTGDAPYTTCVFSNFTLLGPLGASSTIAPNFQHGAHLRRNTRKQIFNTVIAGFPRGIQIQGASVDNAKNNLLKINNSVIIGANTPFFVDNADSVRSWRSANEANWFFDSQRRNDTLNYVKAGFIDAFKQIGKPNFLLNSNSVLQNGSYWDNGIGNGPVPSIDDAFFTQVKFRGAFDGANDWTNGWSEFNPGNKVYGTATDTLGNGNTVSGTPFEITTNVILDKNKVYLLRGWVYVSNGGSLTIPAGTVIRGDKTTVGTIIVERGGKIIANGTVNEPIVFTSNQAVGNRNPGDWGGIIMLGKAPVNRVDPKIEGGPRSIYGGTDPNDNSGILNYVRLEYPGVAFQPNQEINGLTLGGVGQGTKIDYVQISFSGDDAFEWFGGNVNSKYLIAYKSIDDDFDTDFGFSGRVQFGVVLRDPALADVSGSNAFESDNYNPGINATNPTGDAPYTTCVFSNFTLLGPLGASATIAPNFQHGAHLRRNTRKQIFNTVIAGFPRGIQIQGASVDNAKNNLLKLGHSVIAGATTEFFVDAADSVRTWRSANEAEWFRDPKKQNITTSIAQLGFIDAFKQVGKPNFLLVSGLPAGNSPLLRGSYWDGIINDQVVIAAELAQIKVYPNPVSDFLNIDTKLKIKTVYIANSVGQLVKQIPFTNNQIDLLQFQPGMYFILFSTEDGKIYNQRIIKQ